MEVFELLCKLSKAAGPAGFETEMSNLTTLLLQEMFQNIKRDTMGNVIAVRPCGKPGAKKVLLDAHIDEIGFIITGNDEGFLRFSALGSIDARVLPAARVKILTDPPIFGVIDVLPPHVLTAEETDMFQTVSDLRIDAAGVDVPIGTPVVYAAEPIKIGENMLCGKALDNRAGFAAILLALELINDAELDFDLYVLASVQEEVGTRGAKTAAFGIEPDIIIVMDTDFGDQPDVKPEESRKLGNGATIAFGPNTDRELTRKIIATAEKYDISHTVCVEPGDSGTNARELQLVGSGVRTALIGVPLRYMHTPVETVDMRDVVAVAELLAAFLKGGITNE